MKKKNFQVGERWKMRAGCIAVISHVGAGHGYAALAQFTDEEGAERCSNFMADGRYLPPSESGYQPESEYDLVRRLKHTGG